MAILESAIFWIVIAAASEIIALTPLKSNSVVQLILSALRSVKPKKIWIFLQMGAGCFGSIPDRISTDYSEPSMQENFTQHFHTN